MSDLPSITVAEEDYNRLSTLLEKTTDTTGVADSLDEELGRAELKPLAEIPESVVVMNAVVLFEDQDRGKDCRLYTSDGDDERDKKRRGGARQT